MEKVTRHPNAAIRWRTGARFATLVPVAGDKRKDVEREAELRAYQVLGNDDIPALERIVDLAAALTGMAVAEVNVVSTTHVVHVATTNRDHLQVPREHSFCSTVISRDVEHVVVTDARETEPFRHSPYVTGERAAIRSYASARLTSPTGTVLGTLCVFDSELRSVTDDQLATLRSLAAAVMDVLEMRRSELDLARALKQLAGSHRELGASNESLEAFAGQISHDLQSPLSAVEVALELLDEEADLADESRMLLDHARAGARRMSRSITDLLAFAVAGAGSPAVPIALNPVVSDVLDDLSAGLVDAKVEVGDLPTVLGHETELRAVLQNLIANAVKFSAPTGPAIVQVSGQVDGARARVTVSDNGPGIPETQREAVFGLAYRGDFDVGGHGIGLATCARIVHARGGRIGVDRAASGGAAIWFELPAAP